MWIVSLLLLIALGLLGIASRLRQRMPGSAGPLGQLEAIGGWVGLVGLIWGVLLLVQWIMAIGALAAAPVMMLLALVSAVTITALSLILAMPVIKTLAGSTPFTQKLDETASKLGPLKVILGVICLVLAGWTLVMMF